MKQNELKNQQLGFLFREWTLLLTENNFNTHVYFKLILKEKNFENYTAY